MVDPRRIELLSCASPMLYIYKFILFFSATKSISKICH